MGAKGTYIGRANTYGFGCDDEAGVTSAREIVHDELDIAMAFYGRRDLRNLARDILMIPEGFEGHW